MGGGRDKGKGKGPGGFSSSSRVRPSIDKDWRKGSQKGAQKGSGRAAGRTGATSRIPDGHAILLVQFTDKINGKTYSEHPNVSSAMDDVCQMYEQVMKMDMGGRQQVKYTVEDLWSFVDRLRDIACLIYDSQGGEYLPHNREWVKNQVLKHLKGQLT
mmetsp:Transcript_33877/g.78800  ORF Transcript_33877/g.78800 Transcript_33877/m.78800 type:complete len:157 (-) Transcript_33877:80-550(-)|eukprot:s2085_g10.t1